MKILFQLVIICYVCIVLFLLFGFIDANEDQVSNHRRPKRYLAFRNITHFFMRLNFKANMVWWNQIFAQALGFRMNWDEPPDSFHPHHHLYRRTVYENLETLLDRNGISGYHCVRRAICEMRLIGEPRGVYYKILKMVFRQQSLATDKWHNVTKQECPMSINLCPLSLLEVSLYTDV
ncbi:uncharacterized protein LOC113510589 [Galleria mellonella]|uniref:Uncharacterized protein LOC113510589 n=1 Tax=Galleria mellonella TaxID=7137 RepID=A0A6J1WAH0_GALME|nr:uncharacterized protein LOC113510589 [Galleria mellonella]